MKICFMRQNCYMKDNDDISRMSIIAASILKEANQINGGIRNETKYI